MDRGNQIWADSTSSYMRLFISGLQLLLPLDFNLADDSLSPKGKFEIDTHFELASVTKL